jgi:hypothetical protein
MASRCSYYVKEDGMMRRCALRAEFLVLLVALLVCGSQAAGCARADDPGESSVTAQSTSTSSAAGQTAPPAVGMPRVFGDLADALAPMAVYGPAELPPGAAVAEKWWPVLEGGSDTDYQGPTVNPRVLSAQGADPEAEVLLSCGQGWLLVLEDFRGDLGDVSGEAVGSVAGRAAYLYGVNGGWLVQWSDGGRWYGVFGRGMTRETVIDTALCMVVVEAGGPK